MTSRVDLGEVQGNVVRSYGKRFGWARYSFFKVKKARYPVFNVNRHSQARMVVAQWLAEVTFGDASRPGGSKSSAKSPTVHNDSAPGAAFVNVSFTYKGLAALDIPRELLAALPGDFREGAEARAGNLGDHWDKREMLPINDADLMLSVHGTSESAREQRWKTLKKINQRAKEPLEEVHTLEARFVPDLPEPDRSDHLDIRVPPASGDAALDPPPRRERFGFADGLSQPAIEGVDLDAVGDGVYAGSHPRRPAMRRLAGLALEDVGLRPLSRSWRPIRTGEFLLGYENEDGDLPRGSYAPLGPNSTFMVYREIDQHVDVFGAYVKDQAKKLELGEEELRAKIVGRWANGTPAIRHHPEPDGVAGVRRRSNDFLYADDPSGFGCPLGAHARRANPRDALPGGGEETIRHRIIRRGMPYFRGGDRRRRDRQGLAFVCFQSSIENGFEFIQRNWINSGEAFGLGSQQDFLLQEWEEDGNGTPMVIPGYRPIILKPPTEPFVTVRGCEYLFVPSRSACAWLTGFLGKS